MRARYTIYLREFRPGEWEWGRKPDALGWGPYKTQGLARSAAKRSSTKVVGGKTNPHDFEFILLPPRNEWSQQ